MIDESQSLLERMHSWEATIYLCNPIKALDYIYSCLVDHDHVIYIHTHTYIDTHRVRRSIYIYVFNQSWRALTSSIISSDYIRSVYFDLHEVHMHIYYRRESRDDKRSTHVFLIWIILRWESWINMIHILFKM